MNPHELEQPADCIFGPQLDAYYDGELPPELARRFESHLAACPACTERLAELRQFGDALRASLPAEPDPAMLRLIHRKIDQQPDPAVLRTLYRLAAAAAIVLMVCGLEQVRTEAAPAPSQAGEWELAAVTVRPDEAAATPRLASWFYHELSQESQP